MHEDRRLGVSTIVLSSLRTRRQAASPVGCEPRLLWRPLNLYSNIGRAIVGVFFGLLDQVTSASGYIKIKPLASLVPQAALRAVAIALRFRLQIRLIGKRFLLATLNNRSALATAAAALGIGETAGGVLTTGDVLSAGGAPAAAGAPVTTDAPGVSGGAVSRLASSSILFVIAFTAISVGAFRQTSPRLTAISSELIASFCRAAA